MKLVSNTASTEAARAGAFFHLEAPICEISHMASLAADEIMDLTPPENDSEKFARAQFSVFHLQHLIDALRTEYYALHNAACQAERKAVQS